MLNLKVKIAKKIAAELKYSQWEFLFMDSYQIKYSKYTFHKRKISKNYWQFTVLDDITSCTFKMYEKER